MKPAFALAALAVLSPALGGCVSQSLSMRSVPSEDPAAVNAAAADNAAAFAAAAAGADANGTAQPAGAEPQAPPVTAADAPSMITYDPWERVNRFTYRFNARFDEAVFLPVANAYRRVPSPLRAGVHHFFGNLSEVDSVVNYLLQGRLGSGARSLGRFVVNSTVGIGGLLDVASKIKLTSAPTGFSNTLATWGMHPGPFLVIPLLGPSTLRDGVGYVGDFGVSYGVNVANLYRGDQSWGLDVVNAVDQRANVDFRYYASGSPFEYDNIRFLYMRKRLIEDDGLHAKNPRKPARGAKSVTIQDGDPEVPAGK